MNLYKPATVVSRVVPRIREGLPGLRAWTDPGSLRYVGDRWKTVDRCRIPDELVTVIFSFLPAS